MKSGSSLVLTTLEIRHPEQRDVVSLSQCPEQPRGVRNTEPVPRRNAVVHLPLLGRKVDKVDQFTTFRASAKGRRITRTADPRVEGRCRHGNTLRTAPTAHIGSPASASRSGGLSTEDEAMSPQHSKGPSCPVDKVTRSD